MCGFARNEVHLYVCGSQLCVVLYGYVFGPAVCEVQLHVVLYGDTRIGKNLDFYRHFLVPNEETEIALQCSEKSAVLTP